MYKVTLQPSGIVFTVNDEESVLDAALRQGIRLPHRCLQGSCSTCLCRRTEGEIHYPEMEPFLTALEQEEGWIFACLAHPASDLQIESDAITNEES